MFKAAIIGCGNIAGGYDKKIPDSWSFTHAGAYHLCPDTELIAAADTDNNTLDRFSKKWNVRNAYIDYAEMLEKEDIDIVLLTHLHWDHASNNHLFPNARFVVQQKEYSFLTAPEPEAKRGYDPDLVLQTEYELVDGDSDITPGISVILAPGHSVGMQCIVVDTKIGKYILGGDLITLFENWEAVPHIPNGVHYDLEVMLESLEKIDRIDGIVLPGHDQEVFNRSTIYPPK